MLREERREQPYNLASPSPSLRYQLYNLENIYFSL